MLMTRTRRLLIDIVAGPIDNWRMATQAFHMGFSKIVFVLVFSSIAGEMTS